MSKRILYICPCWPHGRSYGGRLRALHVARLLRSLGEVSVAVVSPDPPSEEELRRTSAEFEVEPSVQVVAAANRGLAQRFRRATDRRYLNVHGCTAEPEARGRLLARAEQFDLVWVLNSRLPNILGQWHWPHAVLDLDDLPSTFQQTVWRTGESWAARLKAGVEMWLSRRREALWSQRFPVLAVCSEADRQWLGNGACVHVIPNGFERPAQSPPRHLAQPPRVGFVGLFRHEPNVEGVHWYARQVWPLIKRAIPEACFRLIGEGTDGPLRPQGPDIEALGWVDAPATEIASWSAMVIPVRQGAGTRVKLADAFSRMCPVVSTRLGAFGYDVRHGRDLLLADAPVDFAACCVSLMRDPALGQSLAERAFTAFLRNWTWEAIAPRVWAAAEEGLRRQVSRSGVGAGYTEVRG